MTYSYLDKWDLERLEDNMKDKQQLFLVVDDLIKDYAQHDYEQGYEYGYEEGYDQALLDKECE